MSQHPSLRIGGKIRSVRNVLKRFERIDVLKSENRWNEKDGKVMGLPKTRGTI
ncbi:MAG: small basic protein [Victivallales bacterium]|nr:small basic protein [Victivallales bacterium]